MNEAIGILALLATTACSSAAPIEVAEAAPAEVRTESLPSTLTCGTTSPALSLIYVGNHKTLQTACQGDAATTVVLLHLGDDYPPHDVMAQLASRYRVIVPDLRGYDLGVGHVDEYVQDIVMLIRKSSSGPVIVIGHEAGSALAKSLADRHPEVVAETFACTGTCSPCSWAQPDQQLAMVSARAR